MKNKPFIFLASFFLLLSSCNDNTSAIDYLIGQCDFKERVVYDSNKIVLAVYDEDNFSVCLMYIFLEIMVILK